MSKEAMKLALEALEWINRVNAMDYEYQQKARESLNAIYEALAEQPAQRTWVGLTDEEKSDLWCESTGRDCVNEDTHVFADAIEAKLREKNA